MSGELLEHHRALLEASKIAEDVAAERGYWSATTKPQSTALVDWVRPAHDKE